MPSEELALSLAPGEVAELSVSPEGVASERLAAPNGTEQFLLILGSMELDPSVPAFDYQLSLGEARLSQAAERVTACSLSSDPFRTVALPNETPPSGLAPSEGTTRSLQLPTPKGSQKIEAKVVAVGEHTVVWADTTNPTTLDTQFVEQFLSDFERTIMPRERRVFGVEPDLDGDGHVQLVFSSLTYQTAVAFFTGCDLLPSLVGCPSSNRGEYLYLTPPDAIEPPYNTPNAIKEILAHETSHLLHFTRKVLENQLRSWPDSQYMTEGVGGFAQDVIGYQAGNLYVTQAGLEGLNQFSLGETLADGRAYDLDHDGLLRGGSYLFVRYLYDRGGGDSVLGSAIESHGGPAFLRALLSAPESMASALPELAATRIEDVAMDFFTTLAISNRDQLGGSAAVNPCFAYAPVELDPITGNPRGANLFASFHGMRLKGPYVQKAAVADGRLLSGGVELLQLDGTPAEKTLDFSVQVASAAKPRVRVARLR